MPLTRRQLLLRSAAASSGLLVAGARPVFAQSPGAGIPADPFTLGVASGFPQPDGVVIWTRLAPEPTTGGGMPSMAFPVEYQVATDEDFTDLVRCGTVMAVPGLAHSVRVQLTGLAASTTYWYRFRASGFESRVGRTKTFPLPGQDVGQVRFAVVSCQNYEIGFFTAYGDMVAQDDIDFVVHTGDYVYESGGRDFGVTDLVRTHTGGETVDLEGYRNRWAQYHTDADLQDARAMFPFLLTGDDHEVDNNYAGLVSENDDPIDEFRLRRAAAYQAQFEHQPLPADRRPSGPDYPLYRRLDHGRLLRLHLLDTRQYRDDQACGDGLGDCAERLEPGRTIMGGAQEAWLHDGLRTSERRWDAIGQQVIMAPIDYDPTPATESYNLDAWDSYAAERDELCGVMGELVVANPVVLTGDTHATWLNGVRATDPSAPVVAAELGCAAIAQVGIPSGPVNLSGFTDSPNNEFYSAENTGYLKCLVGRDAWVTEVRVSPSRSRVVGEPFAVLTRFVIEEGNPAPLVDPLAADPTGERAVPENRPVVVQGCELPATDPGPTAQPGNVATPAAAPSATPAPTPAAAPSATPVANAPAGAAASLPSTGAGFAGAAVAVAGAALLRRRGRPSE